MVNAQDTLCDSERLSCGLEEGNSRRTDTRKELYEPREAVPVSEKDRKGEAS